MSIILEQEQVIFSAEVPKKKRGNLSVKVFSNKQKGGEENRCVLGHTWNKPSPSIIASISVNSVVFSLTLAPALMPVPWSGPGCQEKMVQCAIVSICASIAYLWSRTADQEVCPQWGFVWIQLGQHRWHSPCRKNSETHCFIFLVMSLLAFFIHILKSTQGRDAFYPAGQVAALLLAIFRLRT